jgi:hypothetical protein
MAGRGFRGDLAGHPHGLVGVDGGDGGRLGSRSGVFRHGLGVHEVPCPAYGRRATVREPDPAEDGAVRGARTRSSAVGEGRGLQAGWPHLPPHVNPVTEAGNHHPLLGCRHRHGNLAALCTVVIPARVSRLGFLLEESDFVVSLGGIDRGLRRGLGEMIGGPRSGRSLPGSGRRRRWRKEEEEAL